MLGKLDFEQTQVIHADLSCSGENHSVNVRVHVPDMQSSPFMLLQSQSAGMIRKYFMSYNVTVNSDQLTELEVSTQAILYPCGHQ